MDPLRHIPDPTERRCTAHARSGERCRRAPIRGGFVCSMHGGKIPAVRQAARDRLRALVDPALDGLERLLQPRNPCKHCGRSDDAAVVTRAAIAILDRTGFGPQAKLEVGPPAYDERLANLTDEQLVDHLEGLLRNLRGAPRAPIALLGPGEPDKVISLDENDQNRNEDDRK